MATLQLGDVRIAITRKAVKHVHLYVHPPLGEVSLVAPTGTRLDVIRAYVATRLAWIRKQQENFRNQQRETPRQFVSRESHQLWGRQYLLQVEYVEAKPQVRLDHKYIVLQVRPGSNAAKRAEVLHDWHKVQLHSLVPELIRLWEPRLGVKVCGYFLQRMKTRWGSCNHRRGHIRLNTELVKKPRDLLEYIVVHEMTHLLEPTHNERFQLLMDEAMPHWRQVRHELNQLPVRHEAWDH